MPEGGALGDEGDDDDDEELSEAEYRGLLYPQLELNSREKVQRQLVLIEVGKEDIRAIEFRLFSNKFPRHPC